MLEGIHEINFSSKKKRSNIRLGNLSIEFHRLKPWSASFRNVEYFSESFRENMLQISYPDPNGMV